MKIKNGFDLRDICGEYVVLASGRENIDFSQVVNLNESAAIMWKAVQGRPFEPADMAQALLDEYDIDKDTALADAQRIADEWIAIGMAER